MWRGSGRPPLRPMPRCALCCVCLVCHGLHPSARSLAQRVVMALAALWTSTTFNVLE